MVQNVVATVAGDSVAPETEGATEILVSAEFFLRGDANLDGARDIGDPISLLGVLFANATPIDCDDALDANDDGLIDIADAIQILSFLFGNQTLPEPNDCGPDPTIDSLDCPGYTCP